MAYAAWQGPRREQALKADLAALGGLAPDVSYGTLAGTTAGTGAPGPLPGAPPVPGAERRRDAALAELKALDAGRRETGLIDAGRVKVADWGGAAGNIIQDFVNAPRRREAQARAEAAEADIAAEEALLAQRATETHAAAMAREARAQEKWEAEQEKRAGLEEFGKPLTSAQTRLRFKEAHKKAAPAITVINRLNEIEDAILWFQDRGYSPEEISGMGRLGKQYGTGVLAKLGLGSRLYDDLQNDPEAAAMAERIQRAFRGTVNKDRHELYGSALSANETAQYQAGAGLALDQGADAMLDFLREQYQMKYRDLVYARGMLENARNHAGEVLSDLPGAEMYYDPALDRHAESEYGAGADTPLRNMARGGGAAAGGLSADEEAELKQLEAEGY